MPSRADVEAGRAFVRLYLQNDMGSQLTRGLKAASVKLKQFGRSAMATGKQIAMAGAAMTAPFVLATRTFASFDDAMREVMAVTQAVGEDFDRLTDKAKQLGASTSFTARQVAEAMTNLGRAGFDPTQIDVASEHILALARATSTELPDAARIAAGAMNGFSMAAEEMQRISDVQAYTVNNSAQTLTDYGEGLKMVAKLAHEAGANIEDVSSMMAMMADNTIVGTMAGTSIARAYKNLSSIKVDAMLRRLNVSAEDAHKNMRPLSAILRDIGKATAGMGSRERLGIFESLFGRGQIAAITLAAPGAKLRDFRAELDNVTGTAKETAAKMDSGLGGSLRILRSAIEGVQIAIGEALNPMLTKLSKFLTTAAQSSIKWIKANKRMVIAASAAAAVVAALGTALMLLGVTSLAMGMGITAATTSVHALGVALGFLIAHPVVAALVAITMAVAVLVTALSEYNRVVEEGNRLAAQAVDAINSQIAARIAQANYLRKLTESETRTDKETQKAVDLIYKLERYYGNLGIKLDEVTGKFTGVAEAIGMMDKANRRMAIGVMARKLKDLTRQLQDAQEVVAGGKRWGRFGAALKKTGGLGEVGGAVSQLFTSTDTARNKVKELQAAIGEVRQSLTDLQAGGDIPGSGNGSVLDLASAEAASDYAERKLQEIEALKLAAINDEYTRAVATENALHEREKRLAEELGGIERGLEETRHKRAMANIEAENNRRKRGAIADDFDAFLQAGADAQASKKALEEDIESQIARLTIETGGGSEKEKQQQLLNMEHMQALRDAAAQGLGLQDQERINKLYDLKRTAAMQGTSAAAQGPTLTATYSAAAASISGYQPGGGPEKRMVDAAVATAKNTEEIKRQNERAEARWMVP